jgi:hypothetical protein
MALRCQRAESMLEHAVVKLDARPAEQKEILLPLEFGYRPFGFGGQGFL